MLQLSDDLFSNLPELPGQVEQPWTPEQSDEDAAARLLSDPIAVMRGVEAAIGELQTAQAAAASLGDKEKLAQLNAQITAAYSLQSKLMALDILGDMRMNYRKLPNDLKLDLLKITSQHGGLIPKDKAEQGSGFQLNIVLSGAPAAPTPITVENQA